VIVIGIDDTDIPGSPGTNQLARKIVASLGAAAADAIVCRHQLFFDPRVPYTSQNGSASIQLPHAGNVPRDELIARVRGVMRAWFVEGSDPGLAIGEYVTPALAAFAARAKSELVTQSEATAIALQSGCHLAGLGGTNDGMIGALAAVALAITGHDGRVVHAEGWPWPDPFSGVQPADAIRGRGVADIRWTTGEPFTGERVDVGKHLRPSWRGRRIVLLVEPSPHDGAIPRAAKLD
jgi:hypothetical protein